MMTKSKQLFDWQQLVTKKRLFDPSNKEDRREFALFLETKRWDSIVCPFELEWPYLTVPDMIKDKLAHHMLKVEKVWE